MNKTLKILSTFLCSVLISSTLSCSTTIAGVFSGAAGVISGAAAQQDDATPADAPPADATPNTPDICANVQGTWNENGQMPAYCAIVQLIPVSPPPPPPTVASGINKAAVFSAAAVMKKTTYVAQPNAVVNIAPNNVVSTACKAGYSLINMENTTSKVCCAQNDLVCSEPGKCSACREH